MKPFLIFFICCISFKSFSQNKNFYKIKAGQELGDVLSFEDIYMYSAFKVGNVVFFDGRESRALLNYNILKGEIDFVSTNGGDTLSIAEGNTIKYVSIEKDTFYFSEGYLKQLQSSKNKKLLFKKELRVVKMDKLGAYDQTVYAGVDAFGGWSGQRSVKLVVREDITLAPSTLYYLGDRHKFYLLNKKNLLKVYGKREAEINKYLSDNNINFSNEDDLRKMFMFLSKIDS